MGQPKLFGGSLEEYCDVSSFCERAAIPVSELQIGRVFAEICKEFYKKCIELQKLGCKFAFAFMNVYWTPIYMRKKTLVLISIKFCSIIEWRALFHKKNLHWIENRGVNTLLGSNFMWNSGSARLQRNVDLPGSYRISKQLTFSIFFSSLQTTGVEIPNVIKSCIRAINLYGRWFNSYLKWLISFCSWNIRIFKFVTIWMYMYISAAVWWFISVSNKFNPRMMIYTCSTFLKKNFILSVSVPNQCNILPGNPYYMYIYFLWIISIASL